jgi:branched-chain amino acid transport system permease protein
LFTAVQGEGGLHLAWGWPALCAADAAGCTPFPRVRAFAMATAVASLLALALMLAWGRLGLVLRAALRHPRAVEALGHDVPRLFMGVFGIGSALAALAGAVGGLLGAIEPGMAGSVGSVVFAVIVIGGIGSLRGAFVAALFLGMAESFAVGSSLVLGDLLSPFGLQLSADNPAYAIARLSFSQLAAALPFLMLVAVLIVRPQGLLGLSAGNAR